MDKRAGTGWLALFLTYALFLGVAISAGATGSVQDDSRGPEKERSFFGERHYPYGATLPSDVVQSMWNQIQGMPSEKISETAGSPYSWKCIGPFGTNVNYSPTGFGRYMGRILDVEYNPAAGGTRFGSASGGLWGYAFVTPIPLSDQLNSLVIGSFVSKPGDPKTIIVGTGEAFQRSGTGAYKTTDGGATWIKLSTIGIPSAFFRIRYDPYVPGRVHAVTDLGYMRSDDDGDHWKMTTPGTCTDLAFARRGDIKLICLTKWTDGLFLSSDGGDTWAQVKAPGLPTENYGRGAIATGSPDPLTGQSPIFLSYGKNDKWSELLGVYKSIDGGFNWTTITPANPFGAGQLFYDNVISVSPLDSRIVLVGWTKLHRSSDGGASWQLIDNLNPNNHDNTHDDWHALTWSTDGHAVYAGNDGGLSVSFDDGITWTSTVNNAPISQFYAIDVGASDNQVIYGGTQDNGAIGTLDGGTTWLGTLCCDAWSPAIDPTTTSRMYCVMNGRRYRSGNLGLNWGVIDNGLGGAGVLRSDAGTLTVPIQTTPLVYSSSASDVQYSSNYGDNWISLTLTPLPGAVKDIEVPRENISGGPQLLAIIDSNPQGSMLKLYYHGAWYEVSTGFPPMPANGGRVRKVRMLTTNSLHTYALMNGVDAASDGKKVFSSTDRGLHWNNITGNMPNIPLSDIVVDPANEKNMFLGTEMGCYRTWDGGGTWYRWNEGMPQANIVTEMRPRFIDGQLWIVAGTYGRSIWMREANTTDPSKINPGKKQLHKTIADNSSTVDTINATGPSPKGKVLKVSIQLDSLLHPFVRDLIITLRHQGVSDTLVNRLTTPAGGSGANFIATTFDDDATGSIGRVSGSYTGAFRPLQPLSVFNGMDVDGPWILDIFDAQSGNTGTLEAWSLSIDAEVLTGVEPTRELPVSITLSQNYPNPFNPTTTIRYGLPAKLQITLIVYNSLGQQVAMLASGEQDAGFHEVRFNADRLASGMYFYRLMAGEFVQTRKLALVR